MRELIQLQIGECGIKISQKIWEKLLQEHTSEEEKETTYVAEKYMDVYFREQKDGKWKPRSIIADYDPETVQSVMAGPMKEIYDIDNIFGGINSDFKTFAETHYVESKNIMDPIKDSIRKEVEQCDSLQGIQLVAGIGGATGSGLSTSILQYFREELPDKIIDFMPVYPSLGDNLKAFEIYNWWFTMHHSIEYWDMSRPVENLALYQTLFKTLKIKEPTMDQINNAIANSFIDLTAGMRYPLRNHLDLKKITTILKPFPRMSTFIQTVRVPYDREERGKFISSIHHSKSFLCGANLSDDKFISSAVLLRNHKEVGQKLTSEIGDWRREKKNKINYFNFITPHCFIAQSKLAKVEEQPSGMMIWNSGAIKTILKKYSAEFTEFFRAKQYVHVYEGQGMDEMEFTEAESNVNDLISEYTQYSGAYYDDGEGEGEGEDE